MNCPTYARLIVLAETVALGAGCSGGDTIYIGSNQTTGASAASDACAAVPAAPPATLGLGAFYGKYLDASGIPVVSSASVADQALTQACNIVVHMLVKRDDVRQAMIDNSVRMAIIGTGEVTTDLPEYGDLYTAFPDSNWDQMRGVGATGQRPVSSCGEENLLCLSGDTFQGMWVLVQTVAYAIEALGIPPIDATFTSRLQTLYDDAMAAGRFANTFAAQRPNFRFSVGVLDWFDANTEASPADGTDNEINTRVELKAYDPGLAALIAEYLPEDSWRPACP
jgi:hypothetical protein